MSDCKAERIGPKPLHDASYQAVILNSHRHGNKWLTTTIKSMVNPSSAMPADHAWMDRWTDSMTRMHTASSANRHSGTQMHKNHTFLTIYPVDDEAFNDSNNQNTESGTVIIHQLKDIHATLQQCSKQSPPVMPTAALIYLQSQNPYVTECENKTREIEFLKCGLRFSIIMLKHCRRCRRRHRRRPLHNASGNIYVRYAWLRSGRCSGSCSQDWWRCKLGHR